MRRPRLLPHAPARWTAIALAAALAFTPAAAHAAGVATELQPALGFVAPGAEFDVDLAVPVAGASFNGFHATIGYDPAALTFLQATPVSAQQGCLVTGACSSACGLTFHVFQAAGDSLSVDLSLLCDQVSLSGPGQLYRLHFRASNTDQVTYVTTRRASFVNAGVFVNPVTTAGSRIVIGSPAGVDGGGDRTPALRISAEPNPARGPVALSLASARDGVQDVDVLDLSGRMVRRLSSSWQPHGTRRLAWDGTDTRGAGLPAGIYLVRLRVDGQLALARVTVIHSTGLTDLSRGRVSRTSLPGVTRPEAPRTTRRPASGPEPGARGCGTVRAMFRPAPVIAAAALLLAAAARSAPPAHSPAPAAVRHSAPAAPRAPHAASPNGGLQRDTLAWVGDRAITALDLVQRIEWMPWPEKHAGADMATIKLHALHSLAAEALLARESERRSPGGGADFSRTREALRRALARDALYRHLGAEAPPPSPAEITALAQRMHPQARADEMPTWRRIASDSLRALAGQRRATEFLVAHLAGKQATVDSAAFMMLADTLRAYMLGAQADTALGGGIIVPAEAPDVLLERLAPALDRPLAQLPDGPLTIGDAVEDMRFYLYATHSLRPRRFAVELSGQLRLLVEGELMAREALRRHMDERPETRHDLRTWTDAWRAISVLGTVVAGGPAGDDETMRAFAQAHPDRARTACEVDVQEILCGTPDEALAVRAALDAGAPFDSLARRHSRRAEWAGQGGRSGFFPVSRHPELGFTALLARPDTLIGPLRLPEGISLYRVLGKRLAPDSLEVREEYRKAREQATHDLRTDRAARYIGSLASGTRVRFSDAALARVDILPANMVVRRTLGFGGGMTAAPSLQPIWQWTRYWTGGHEPLP